MIAAVVPAAGHSQRMGRPKLTLPVDGGTVIARVVQALRQGGVERVIVVAPPPDVSSTAALVVEAESAGARVITPAVRPEDMRASFECGLDALVEIANVSTVLLAPGDSVGITVGLVEQVVAHAKIHPDRLIVPVTNQRRGHPVALPQRLLQEIRALPKGVGINALLKRHHADVIELPVEETGAVEDLDTPEDYARWAPPADNGTPTI